GVLMTFGPDPRKNPQAAPIVKVLKEKGYDPAGYTLYSYGAVQIVAEAIKMAGAADSAKAIPIMLKTNFKTVLGDISFNAKGDLTAPAFTIYRWHNGQYEER
ncbi:MAG: branched-chain amino acid ABC transporter substrate-binding protein, partial [Proteobacteria bacterium]|nr:branched-chain amino acid ABC transporter substrate-binding protein [Pseudomonadota bacterium]